MPTRPAHFIAPQMTSSMIASIASIASIALIAWGGTTEGGAASDAPPRTPQIIGWGAFDAGQRNWLPPAPPSVAAVTGAHHVVSLDADGGVLCWGDGFHPLGGMGYPSRRGPSNPGWGQSLVPSNLGPVVAVAAGDLHTVVLEADGTVRAWGSNGYWFMPPLWAVWDFFGEGQSQPPADLARVVAIAAGRAHSLALQVDGTLRAWGRNFVYGDPAEKTDYRHIGQCDVPEDLGPVIAFDGGHEHSVALLADGSIRCWGAGTASPPSPTLPFHFGQSIVPASAAPASAIAAGGYHTVALGLDGVVRCWGAGTSNTGLAPHFGQSIVPTDLSPAVAIAAGEHHTAALLTDGRVRRWGRNLGPECTIPAQDPPIVSIDARGNRTLARLADGQVLVWTGCDPTMVEPVPGRNGAPIEVAAGSEHSLVLFENGAIEASGPRGFWTEDPKVNLEFGGWFPTSQHTVPHLPAPAVAIACGSTHNLALLETGQVVAWGQDFSIEFNYNKPPFIIVVPQGATVVPDDLGPVVGIAAGLFRSLAVLANGEVRCWGQPHAACTVPADLPPAVEVATGGSFSLARLATGELRCWGDTCWVPGDLTPAVKIAAEGFRMAALLHDGTARAWTTQGVELALPEVTSPIADIAIVGGRVVLLLADGSIACGAPVGPPCPGPADLPPIATIASGGGFALAISGLPAAPRRPGDLDGDGVVDGRDLGRLLGAWGPCPTETPCPADLSLDGAVGSADLAILLAYWGG